MKKFNAYLLAALAEVLATAFLLTLGIAIAGAFGYRLNSMDDLESTIFIGALAFLSAFFVMIAVKSIFAKIDSAHGEPEKNDTATDGTTEEEGEPQSADSGKE